MLRSILLLPLAALAACAPTPESIQPAYVSEVPYQSWTCQQLGEELARLNNALSTASIQQNSARSNDVAGVIFLGLPVGSMSGQSVAPQIARYKGEQEAVNRALIRNSCGEMRRLYPPAPAGTVNPESPLKQSGAPSSLTPRQLDCVDPSGARLRVTGTSCPAPSTPAT